MTIQEMESRLIALERAVFLQENTKVAPGLCFNNICLVIERRFGIMKEDLIGKRKHGEVVNFRHIAINMMLKNTEIPLVALGKMFNRDHTTVIHAREKHNDRFFIKEFEYIQLYRQVESDYNELIKPDTQCEKN